MPCWSLSASWFNHLTVNDWPYTSNFPFLSINERRSASYGSTHFYNEILFWFIHVGCGACGSAHIHDLAWPPTALPPFYSLVSALAVFKDVRNCWHQCPLEATTLFISIIQGSRALWPNTLLAPQLTAFLHWPRLHASQHISSHFLAESFVEFELRLISRAESLKALDLDIPRERYDKSFSFCETFVQNVI